MVNMPLVEALEKMSGYTKFMKDLVINKKTVNYELVDNIHHCSVIVSRYPRAFTVLCIIGAFSFDKALRDLRANINLMPL